MSELKTAAVYIRVSTDEQTELSPESQLATIRDYAEKNGYIVPEEYIFVDGGISGRTVQKRPEFNRMIATVKDRSHPVDAILVWKFSRFARNQEESILYKALLRKSDVNVVSISEPIIDGPFGSLIERIIEWWDEYYSINLSSEVKRSMTVNAKKGIRQTAPPFGYQRGPEDGPFMVPNPAEAEIIKETFARYTAGAPVWELVRDFNARGIRTHRGNALENRTITYWLQNPVYIGKNRWTPTGRTRRDFHNPCTVIVDGDHEAIVSQELFDQAQTIIRRQSEMYKPKSRPSFELKDWMGGICRCSACGSTLTFQQPRYFVCNGYIHAKCNTRNSITTDALHKAVLARLSADLSPAAQLEYKISSSTTGITSQLHALWLEAQQLDRKLLRVRDAYAAGIDSLEEYKKYRADIAARQDAIKTEIAQLQNQFEPEQATTAIRHAIAQTLKTLQAPDTTVADKNHAARELIDTCIWQKSTSTLRITYRLTL